MIMIVIISIISSSCRSQTNITSTLSATSSYKSNITKAPTNPPIPEPTEEPLPTPTPTPAPFIPEDLPIISPKNLDQLTEIRSFRFAYPELDDLMDFRYSPDGKILGLMSSKSIMLFDSSTLSLLKSFSGIHFEGMAFSNDNRLLAISNFVGTNDIGNTILFDLESNQETERYDDYYGEFLAISPNNELILIANSDNIFVLDRSSKEELYRFRDNPDNTPIKGLVWSEDGKQVFIANSRGNIFIWDVGHNNVSRMLKADGDIREISLSSDNSLLVTAGGNGVSIIDTITGKTISLLKYQNDGFNHVDISPDGKFVAASTNQENLFVWSVETGNQVNFKDSTNGYFVRFHFSPDGKNLATYKSNSGLTLWNVSTWEKMNSSITLQGMLINAVFSPSQNLLAGTIFQGQELSVRVLNMKNGIQSYILPGFGISFSSDETNLAVSSGQEGTIRFVDLIHSSSEISRTMSTNPILSIIYSLDGRYFYTFDLSGQLILWDRSTWEKLQSINLQGQAFRVVISPDGGYLLIDTASETTRIVQVPIMKEKTPLQGRFGAISADGSLVATFSKSTITLWSFPEGNQKYVLRGPQKRINSIAFSPTGKLLIAGIEGPNLWIWDLNHLEKPQKLSVSTELLSFVSFSPDGRLILLGQSDGSIHIWGIWDSQATLDTNPSTLPSSVPIDTPTSTDVPEFKIPSGMDITTIGIVLQPYQLIFDPSKWEKISDGKNFHLGHLKIKGCTISENYGLPEGGNPKSTQETKTIGENSFKVLTFGSGKFTTVVYMLQVKEPINAIGIKISGANSNLCLTDIEEVLLLSSDLLRIYQ